MPLNLSGIASQLVLDPTELNPGRYLILLNVTDSGSPELSDSESVYIEVVTTLAPLSDADSDGDLIPDFLDGYKDSDGDFIPDYLDRINQCNVLQTVKNIFDAYLIEGDPGVCLRRGYYTLDGETGGAQITSGDINNNTEDVLIADTQVINISGIYDFTAYDLSDNGASYAIAIPLRKPIPTNAIYRKLSPTTGWGVFIEDQSNSLWSTAGEPGYCPPPNHSDTEENVWTAGLIEGYWCVQLIILDGGPNDDDGVANSTIVDPGGIGVTASANHLPVAVDDIVDAALTVKSLLMYCLMTSTKMVIC